MSIGLAEACMAVLEGPGCKGCLVVRDGRALNITVPKGADHPTLAPAFDCQLTVDAIVAQSRLQ